MDNLVESSAANEEPLQVDEDSKGDSLFNDNKWEWSYLRKKCRNLELEQYYQSYMHRLRLSYLNLFIFIGALVAILHSALIIISVGQSTVYVDVCIYIGAALLVWIVLAINFREDLVKRNPWIMYVTSWMAVAVLVIADLSVPIYHSLDTSDTLRPTYGSYILYAIYIFLPLPNNVHAFIMGLAVSASYLVVYGLVTYRKQSVDGVPIDEFDDEGNIIMPEISWKMLNADKILSEAIFLLCVNMFGIYFRLMKEIAIRTTFLDRRQCVEENLLLRYARDQEKSLLLSIIPAQIANKIEQDVKMRIEQLKMQNKARATHAHSVDHSTSPPIKRWRQPDTEKLFIEPHNDVSILYADVVNYTFLTTTLDVKTLVETLHDLFVKFDLASEEYNVLRIKFLGDCYYCVAGVPIANDQHAKCCIDLGLRMIKDIRDVRTKRKLDIDMRIGVHSGNILSGVIGASKWQFDIWSKDVDIANRLEQTGVAGRVHVSEQTLQLLDGEYMYEEGTKEARSDVVLRKYRIRTFLIKPPKSFTYLESRRHSGAVRRQIDRHKNDMKANFMQNTILQYNHIRTQAKLEMNRELDKMPIGRIQVTRFCFGRTQRLTQDEIEEQSFRSNITTCCLFFKDWRWEVAFMKESDVMLKYSLLFSVITFLAVMAMQPVNDAQNSTWWMIMLFDLVLLLFFLFCTWNKKLWIMFVADSEQLLPETPIGRCFYRLSDKFQGSVVIRIVIYVLLMFMFVTCALYQLNDCNRIEMENYEVQQQFVTKTERDNLCFNPWAVTESLMMAICMGFLFTRIPFALKSGVGIIICGFYIVIVSIEFDFIFEKTPSTNVGLYSEYAHIMAIVLTLVIFHMMDRQTEFISKVDFNWNRQLQKKQDDAKFTNETIKILIHNILPSHVADIYMTKKMQNELYFEEYENVAVMFATIKNYDTEKVGLRVLNEIICDFDSVLSFYKGHLKIEKIKVAGWTYMAACGLDIARAEHGTTPTSFRASSLLPNGRRSHHNGSTETITTLASTNGETIDNGAPLSNASSKTSFYEGHVPEKKRSLKISNQHPGSVVYVMAQFALDLMRTMHAFNMENLQYEDIDKDQGMLRIGISNGEIMAGVVGSYKPHYDIWGNPVNMASRMDSTGVPGRIQVTEETANILKSFDIRCVYRGMTNVKGRGEIPTFFIAIDKDLNFIRDSIDAQSSYDDYGEIEEKESEVSLRRYSNDSSIDD